MSPPRTRLRARKQNPPSHVPATATAKATDLVSSGDPVTGPLESRVDDAGQPPNAIQVLPSRLTSAHTKLSRDDHQLLLSKQARLQKYAIQVPRDFRKHDAAAQATLVFAQEEAGTAVCVSPDGLLLTCAHCVAEDDAEPDPESLHWLLFASGQAVAARCVAWDERRDLALLRVVAAQAEPTQRAFPFVQTAETGPSPGDKLVCVGHPGSEDFEAAEPGLKTGYDVLHLSTGSFRGYADGQDLQDNSEIGALQHDCWTYWGHSGAPLFDRRSGRLVGLHSSWDDETAMRRGVALEAIAAFLSANV
ncbi:trypsin-like serine protease [Coniochaeta ligniaria NRRL 30616]|uniref:Trypsin-like serine protease n=1 Tax=Coniochaeta ligniaria NRRL 30616 TaxID=1408157 RepID=A0A1J7ILG9_9PEZI|nr:trypsin-like serine protease [Coniochaeta ligniaria NRRL 30616]